MTVLQIEFELFPRMNNEGICLSPWSTYKIKQAPGYYADDINESGDFEFQIATSPYRIDYQ